MEGKTNNHSNHNHSNSASASPSLSALLNNPPSPSHQKSTSSAKTDGRTSPPPQRHASPPHPKAVEMIKAGVPGGAKGRSAATSAAPSNASSPKPMRPVVNGLLGNNAFNDSILDDDGAEQEVPTIILHVPINGETNKYVNFTKLAEEQYGWAALNPRLARARERLGRDSGDEMMLDASESESAMEEKVGPANDSAAAAGAPAKKKRRKIEETYDSGDPFIDDSELAWEEQAAASKDGFFVYSGPLVPEGEKPQVERADGSVKRSRGARSGRGGSSKANAGKPSAPRKPRLTKVAKEKISKEEKEKAVKSSGVL